MRRFVTFGPAVVMLLATALVLVAAPNAMRAMQFSGIQASVERARVSLNEGGALDQDNVELSALADAVLPSVVHLSVRYQRFGGPTSNASAWIYDDLGHIVTNADAVANAERITSDVYAGRVQ